MKFDARKNWMHSMSKYFLIPLIATAASAPASFAQTAEAIESAINSSKLLPPEYKIRAAIAIPEVTITTYRNAKASDQDCKIDAILIAQKVMETFKTVAAVRTQFHYVTDPKRFDQVEIHAGDVKAFGAGGMTKQRLLDSLPISKGAGNSGYDKTAFQLKLKNYTCVPGYALKQRSAVLAQLRAIEHNMGDARDLWPPFVSIENKVKLGFTDELMNEINMLTARVAQYNESVKTAYAVNSQKISSEHDKLIAKAAAESFEPHMGPMYENRKRLAGVIKTRMAAGEDMKRQIDYLINTIEVLARRGDLPHLQAAVNALEAQLNLTPLRAQ